MIYVVIAFLWLSVCLYVVFGGADFGGGIVELFAGKKTKKKVHEIMHDAIAPVWEANHMWLIIAIVILFVGFPAIYAGISTYLHIPLVLMLVGIIARGTAFTFRNYDAVADEWQVLYSRIFYAASLLTPFFLGVIAAATVSSSINPDATTFLDLYFFSWLNVFGVSVGLFTIGICAYLACLLSIRETRSPEEVTMMIAKSKKAMVLVVITGALVFLAAYYSGIPLFDWIFSKPLGIASVVVATILLGLIFYCMKHRKLLPIRLFAGMQVVLILVAATYQHYPDIVLLANGNHFSLLEHAAPQATIDALGWALLIGSVFILPFLFYLMFTMRRREL